MRTSDNIADLAAALAAAASGLDNVRKGHRAQGGKRGSYSYASIADVVAQVSPVLARQNLVIVQGQTREAEGICVETRLLHSSGQWVETDTLVPADRQGGPQGVGSAITYARRYGLLAILGIAAEDDDAIKAREAEEARRAREAEAAARVDEDRRRLIRMWHARLGAIDAKLSEDARHRVQGAIFRVRSGSLNDLDPARIPGALEWLRGISDDDLAARVDAAVRGDA